MNRVNYTEAQLKDACEKAHFWGWLCRERLDGPDSFPVTIPFPPELDYEEKEDFCFDFWWENFISKS